MISSRNTFFKALATTIFLMLTSVFELVAKSSIDAGLKPKYVSITDHVWIVVNNKDLQDTVQGVKLELYASENSMVADNTITLKYINRVGSSSPKTNFVQLTKSNEKNKDSISSKGKTNTYDVKFSLKVKNYGMVAFTGVLVEDNLGEIFGDNVKIDSVNETVDDGLTATSSYTGRGNLINLLGDSLSTLPVNTERNVILFTPLTRLSSKSNFENQALVIGKYLNNKSVDDLSTNGNDPDPNNNNTPKDNCMMSTTVKFGDKILLIPLFNTTLAIAKATKLDSAKHADGSINLTYKLVVKNYGTSKLTNIQLSDSLNKVFTDSAEFVVVGKTVLGKNSKLKIDSTFIGRAKTTMIIADNSSLTAGATDTLIFKLRLLSAKKGDATHSKSIKVTAKDGSKTVKDVSQSGINPDPAADNNPGNNNQQTLITIKGQSAITDATNRAKIPQAFSPNVDGKIDLFVIKGINDTDNNSEIFYYDKWGQLVYQNSDFDKVSCWNSEANNGIILEGKGVGVPDGTYFIHIKAIGSWYNKPQINFITIVG
jgi:gliding motility-associated-like protein